MPSLLCAACGRPYSEFDAQCAGCGERLPMTLPTTEGLPATQPEPLGRTVSHFQIVGLIGSGGMGVVYRARDLELGREVALKFLSPLGAASETKEARFLREARAAASLDHPNIGTVYEVGEHGGQRFIAMALYEGETLERRLAREAGQGLPFAEAAAVAGQLASALSVAHAAGIAHRDLKPSNVLLTRHGRVKLLDFGLARRLEDATLTEAGQAIGTAGYMAPERLLGHESGPAVDLWSFGVLLHEMLAGQRPFGGERPGLVHSILHEEPPPLRETRPGIPEAFARIVESCLAKEPESRPPGADWIVAELETAGLWTSGGSSSLAVPRTRRPWLPWAWAGAALLVLSLAIAGFLLARRPPESPLYVAVLRPEVAGAVAAEDRAQVAANLQAALLRTVAALDGLAALDSSQVNKIKGSPAAVARAVAAREVVASHSDCAGDLCQVSLQRLAGSDGRVLWTETLRLPLSKPLLFADAVAAALRHGYADRGLRLSRLELEVDEEDYRAFLALRQRLAGSSGKLAGVLDRLGELRQRAPSFLEAYVLEAKVAWRLYLDTGEQRYLDRGLTVARQALDLAPEDPRPLEALFSLQLDSGRLDEAEKTLERMRQTDPAATLLRRGKLAERRGRPEEALKLLTEAARFQPSWQTLLTVANAEYRLGRVDAARRHLEDLLRRSPGNVEGLRTLAQVELLRQPERAVALLRDAARLDPSSQSLTNLGVALLLLRRYGEAEASLRRALTLQPDDPSAALNLADCLVLSGRADEARKLYSGIATRAERPGTTGNWQRLAVRAQALAHLGDTAKAVEAIQQALRLTPDNGQLSYEAAVVYVLIGDRGSALFHARQAAQRGVDAYWFALPFFDPIRGELASQPATSKAG